MNYSVRVKPQHATGVRRRGGKVFGLQPTIISEKDMTKEIRTDPWLIVTEVKIAPAPAQTQDESAPEDEGGKKGKGGLGKKKE